MRSLYFLEPGQPPRCIGTSQLCASFVHIGHRSPTLDSEEMSMSLGWRGPSVSLQEGEDKKHDLPMG